MWFKCQLFFLSAPFYASYIRQVLRIEEYGRVRNDSKVRYFDQRLLKCKVKYSGWALRRTRNCSTQKGLFNKCSGIVNDLFKYNTTTIVMALYTINVTEISYFGSRRWKIRSGVRINRITSICSKQIGILIWKMTKISHSQPQCRISVYFQSDCSCRLVYFVLSVFML